MVAARRRERILKRLIEQEMKDSFLDYSMSVIVQRAIPDVRDGLKPVHRRILFAMHELGLTPERPYKKCATVVGDVLGKYHPHGDNAVYDALVRMVQDFSLRYPLIDGQGNFGSIDGDSAAAYRYTEARLAASATELLEDIEKETVDFEENFDGRLQEPSVLPGRFPNFLVNGSSGIAVGMSTNVPPHNLREIAAGIRLLVGEAEVTPEALLNVIPGPDFPTGGFIIGRSGIESMYKTGRGRMKVRARVVKESLSRGKSQLVITELPYAVNKTRILKQIADLSRKGKIDDVSDLRDESDRDGIRVVIELKRNADAGGILKKLYRMTPLETTFGAILLALDHGQPKEFNLLEALEHYRDHRVEVIRRRSTFRLEKAEAEKHIIQGIIAALDDIDAVIAIIRGSQDRPEALERLQARLGLSEVQANAILNMRLARLTSLERITLDERMAELSKTIKELRAILKSEAKQIEVMLGELDELVELYGDDRRTVIVDTEPDQDLPETVQSAVADEDVVITVSHQGFAKRIPMHIYQRRTKSGKSLADMEKYDDDFLEKVFVARTSGWLLAFTEKGHTYFQPVLEVPEGGRATRGQSLYGMVGGDRSDRIVALLPVEELDADRYLVFLSKKGLIKRTALREFSNPRVGGIKGAGVNKGDEIFDVTLSGEDSEVMLVTSGGRAIRFPESDVSVVGRTARGVKGVDLKGEDTVVGMVVVRPNTTVLTIAEDGVGKRTPVEDFPLQKRGGMGTQAVPPEQKAPLAGALEIVDEDQIMIIAANGGVTRVDAAEVAEKGRRNAGVRLLKLEKGDRVVELARVQGSSAGVRASVAEPEADEDVDPDEGVDAGVQERPGGLEGQLDLLG